MIYGYQLWLQYSLLLPLLLLVIAVVLPDSAIQWSLYRPE